MPMINRVTRKAIKKPKITRLTFRDLENILIEVINEIVNLF